MQYRSNLHLSKKSTNYKYKFRNIPRTDFCLKANKEIWELYSGNEDKTLYYKIVISH